VEEKHEFPTEEKERHVHDYNGRTSVDRGHFHTFAGSTGLDTSAAGGHIHDYASETRPAENHTHRLLGITGLEMPLMFGHTHKLEGTTSVEENHSHTYDLYSNHQRLPRNVKRGKFLGPFAAKLAAGGRTQRKLRPRLRRATPTDPPVDQER